MTWAVGSRPFCFWAVTTNGIDSAMSSAMSEVSPFVLYISIVYLIYLYCQQMEALFNRKVSQQLAHFSHEKSPIRGRSTILLESTALPK